MSLNKNQVLSWKKVNGIHDLLCEVWFTWYRRAGFNCDVLLIANCELCEKCNLFKGKL